MSIRNPLEIKERIISALKRRGPSLPVHIAKEMGMDILFTSAFLSDLIAEKNVKISHMKVGNSPLYFCPEQENMLKNFAHYLKSKEKDAYLLLEEKRFLKDDEQEPAIRVALRKLKDFAKPLEKQGNLFWRFFETPEEQEIKGEISTIKEQEIKEESLEIAEKKPKKERTKIERTPKKTHKKAPQRKKQNEKFLERVKEFLAKHSGEIINIEEIGKSEFTLRIKIDEEEQLLIAYNKKRICEKDIIKAAKKSKELNLKYSVLSLGDLPKKISDLIIALQNIKNIEKID